MAIHIAQCNMMANRRHGTALDHNSYHLPSKVQRRRRLLPTALSTQQACLDGRGGNRKSPTGGA